MVIIILFGLDSIHVQSHTNTHTQMHTHCWVEYPDGDDKSKKIMIGQSGLPEGPCKVYRPQNIIIDLDGLLNFKRIDVDIFVPYIRNNTAKYLEENWNSAEVSAIVNELRTESFDGKFAYHYNCPLIEEDEATWTSVLAYMEWQHYNLPESPPVAAIHKLVLDKGMDDGKIVLNVEESSLETIKSWSKEFRCFIVTNLDKSTASRIMASIRGCDLNKYVSGIINESQNNLIQSNIMESVLKSINATADTTLLFTCAGKVAKCAEALGIDVVLLSCWWNKQREYYLLKYPYVSSLEDVMFVTRSLSKTSSSDIDIEHKSG